MIPRHKTASLEALDEAVHAERRAAMVEHQLVRRGILDERVLGAFRRVPRHRFVPPRLIDHAYADHPLPIGHDQTISQPLMVAEMVVLLAPQPGERVLDVGAGSGYQAAILAALGAEVHAVERVAALAEEARERLARLELPVSVHVGDGSAGWPEAAPYDGIVVGAAAPEVPAPLVEQLAPGGRLVVPVGPRAWQELVVVRRTPDGTIERETHGTCAFVPLIGESGW